LKVGGFDTSRCLVVGPELVHKHFCLVTVEQAQPEEGRDWLHSPQCDAVRLRYRGKVSAEGELAGDYAEYALY
jgi:hypothetical protein